MLPAKLPQYAAVFVLGALVGAGVTAATSNRLYRAPNEGAPQKSFTQEMSEVNHTMLSTLDRINKGDISDGERYERYRAWRVQYDEAVVNVYRKHGEPFPRWYTKQAPNDDTP